jgi:hypothetical protein
VVYFIASLLFKSEEMRALKNLISRLLSRSQDELDPQQREPVDEDSIME